MGPGIAAPAPAGLGAGCGTSPEAAGRWQPVPSEQPGLRVGLGRRPRAVLGGSQVQLRNTMLSQC